jgi:hypothetical protein
LMVTSEILSIKYFHKSVSRLNPQALLLPDERSQRRKFVTQLV